MLLLFLLLLLMMFTNTGKVHCIKAYMIPEAGRTAKGTYLANVLQLADGEKVTTIISIDAFNEGEHLMMITRRGVIKRTELKEFEYQRKGGKIAISLDEGDELLFVVHTKGGENIMIATANGAATRFDEETVRVMGRTARGVRGMRLADDDVVVGAVLVDEEKMLMTVTEGGYGKRTDFSEFRQMKNRGGSGVICHNISDKTGKLAGICAVDEQDDLMLITDQGTIIRTPVAGINTYSRSASGVIVMRLDDEQKIVNFTKVSPDEKKDEETEQSPAEQTTEIVVPVLEE